MALGQNIKKYRKEKKLTQKELASLAGVNEVTIRSYEAEKYRPKIETLQKIAEALDVSLAALDPILYENTFDKRVGKNIAAIRIRKNISQNDLGQLLNISIHDIEQLESGNTTIKSKDIENIAERLNVPIEALIFGADVDYNIFLEDDKSDIGRKISKQLSIVKFLDALYARANITKVKIYSKDSKSEIHNTEYISYYDGTRSDNLCIDYEILDKLINIFENICNNLLPEFAVTEDYYLHKNFSVENNFYRLYTETIKFQTSTKIKYEPYSDIDLEELRKEIEETANSEEFIVHDDTEASSKNPNK